ncbi:ABC transporter substrate-binding protein [Paenibacillus lignilyticus]|uniref:ABC transporter substrate-binding protein n=1 Tax=Paenibacillus lignilyticus TaxID=1172615 RepID=A0ABS5CJ05_9BACL|nr:ABC transporter substrate-binding protein [Paenibacillus lignilyticus]MBP3965867.1 ABC transporter substrate-binding protein [Paenibacillus lignilyticus]
MKKQVAKLSVVLMTSAIFLAACGSNNGNENANSGTTNAAANSSTSTTDTNADASTNANTTAADPAQDELKPVDLTWYYPLPAIPADLKTIEEAVNKITQEKINATIHMKPQAFGDYAAKMNVVVSSGEESDIIWTSNWLFPYGDNVAKGAFIPLDDLIAKYPDLQQSMPGFVWDATKVGGKVYGVPNYQTVTNRDGFKVVKSIADKYKFDPNTIKNFEDMEPFLETVKKGEPGKIPFAIDLRGFASGYLHNAGNYEFWGALGAIKLDGTNKVVNLYDTPEYKAYLDLAHRWYTKGIISEDAATVKNSADVVKTGNAVSQFHNVLSADVYAAEKAPGRLGDVVLAYTSNTYASTGTIITTMQAISKTSKNPERAMMFINLINTDKDLYNLLVNGIKDKNYTLGADNVATPIADSGYSAPGWVLGNTFNAYLTPGKTTAILDQVKKDNETATPSPLMGFNFDPQAVSAETAAVTAVVGEYGPGLNTGTIDPSTKLAEFQAKLKEAGADKIVAEVQKQLDAWLASK